MAEEFLVDKSTVSVTVCLGSGRLLQGRVFVHAVSQHHEGPESVEDLLNGEREFVPVALDPPECRTVLVGLEQIRWVRAPRQRDVLHVLARAASTPVVVDIELDDGSPVSGLLYIGLPPGRTRTLDFLTQPARFLSLIQQEHEVFVRRGAIAAVRDESQDWLEAPDLGPVDLGAAAGELTSNVDEDEDDGSAPNGPGKR